MAEMQLVESKFEYDVLYVDKRVLRLDLKKYFFLTIKKVVVN
jgi:lipopolysaccharide/colanic/teichoic acid biosynthesis glycosyltransferase